MGRGPKGHANSLLSHEHCGKSDGPETVASLQVFLAEGEQRFQFRLYLFRSSVKVPQGIV